MSETTRLNKAVSRAVDILELFAKQRTELSLAEISRVLGIPKSSAFDILHTLTQCKMLRFHAQRKTFSLGIHTFEIGHAYLSNSEVHIIARPVLKELSLQTGETAFLAVENNGMIVYLDKVEGVSPTRTTCVIGDRNTMHTTGLGKAILATKPIEEIRSITGGGALQPKTPFSLTHFNQLMEDLEATRRRGHSIDKREDVEFVFCVSAPILNMDSECIAAISISTFYTPNTEEHVPEYKTLVTKAALEVSRRLGYTGENLFQQSSYGLT